METETVIYKAINCVLQNCHLFFSLSNKCITSSTGDRVNVECVDDQRWPNESKSALHQSYDNGSSSFQRCNNDRLIIVADESTTMSSDFDVVVASPIDIVTTSASQIDDDDDDMLLRFVSNINLLSPLTNNACSTNTATVV